jgi:hypothetical protein
MGVVDHFRVQAEACADLGSPMYAALLDRAADDLAAGGVVASMLAGHHDDPGPSGLALRLLGSVHRLVLQGRADELAAFYPSVGGRWDLDAAWPAFERLLRDHPEDVREVLDRPPQTNEVGRASALMGGLLRIDRAHPVRLFEIGSSAGLNLRADRFAYTDSHGRRFGDPAAGLLIEEAWLGRQLEPWPDLRIVERVGSDVSPVDPTTDEGRLTLTSYVWPDQEVRLARLRGALDVARAVPAEVRRADAVSFVGGLDLRAGSTTVLWHSVMWQYLSRVDQQAVTDRVGALGQQATAEQPFAHLFLEPTRRTPDVQHEFLVVLETWPGGDRQVLGTSVGHGVPTTWE